MAKTKVMGKPRIFKDEQAFLNNMNEYINSCNEKQEFPNVAGFCVFMDIGRQTFYDQKAHYPYTYEKVENVLENATINSKYASDTWKIFYSKNKHGYRDRFVNEVEHTKPIEINMNLNKLSTADLLELKKLSEKVKDE